VDDVRELVAAFATAAHQAPVHTYMTGASEGGIITTLLIERYPALFSGGLAACGPIGDFQKQLNYWGDYRMLFDYFVPGVLPTDVITVPQTVIDTWDTTYVPALTSLLAAEPMTAAQLVRTANAPIDPANPATTAVSTTLDVMRYNVFATNDGIQELGGVPFDNTHRWYHGSTDDVRLNLLVQRVQETAPAATIARYQTSGNLTLPLVTLHTTGDDVIPFWHELLYAAKAHLSGLGRLTVVPVASYGHCNFSIGQVLSAFALLVHQVTGNPPADITQDPAAQQASGIVRQRLAVAP
jgi:alpha-beta hydrolase superfamily lysophospholipase